MDLEVINTGNGGDLFKVGNDLSMVFSFENMPYLALFGGNRQSTPAVRNAAEQAFDWWGNSLFPNEPSLQINSLTETAILSTPLTSAGRLIIENAISADLEFMRDFAIISISTEIISDDVLKINIGIKKPDNLQATEFIYIWERGKLAQTRQSYRVNTQPSVEYLEYDLQFELTG
jgi:hypothetical protein